MAAVCAPAIAPHPKEIERQFVEKREPWAIKIAIEYAAGKPTQAVEMSGPDGGPIQTQEINEAAAKLTQEERLALLALHRKAGPKLPGEA